MAYLMLNGIPVPVNVTNGPRIGYERIGPVDSRAWDGRLASSERTVKREWELETGFMKYADAERLKMLIEGKGDIWGFDDGVISSKGIAPLPDYVATLRPGEGRFGGAVAVEEGTTNLASTMVIAPHGCSMEDAGFYGNVPVKRLTVTTPDTVNNFGFRSNTDVNLNQSGPNYVTISFWANVIINPGTLVGYVRVHYTDGTEEIHNWTYSPSNWWNISGWQRVTGYATLNPSKTPQYITAWYVYRDNASQGQVDIAGIQIEQKPFATSFVDGTRATGKLEYPTSLLIGNWTFSAWLKRNYTGLYQGVAGFGSYESDSDFMFLILNYDGMIYWGLKVDGTVFFLSSWGDDPHINDTENWHHHVVQVDNDALKARYFLDGVLFREKALPSPVPPITKYQSFGLGRYYTSSGIKSILFDELLILPYAASEEEILAIYNSTTPYPQKPYFMLEGELFESSILATGAVEEITFGSFADSDGNWQPDGVKMRIRVMEV